MTPFIKVINEKYFGDITRWVHNTGRYYNGYSDVSVDTIPQIITQKDALSSTIIKGANDAFEKLLDTYIDQNVAMDVPVLVSRTVQKKFSELEQYQSGGKVQNRTVSRQLMFTYDNYFYGQKASDIKSASECGLVQ